MHNLHLIFQAFMNYLHIFSSIATGSEYSKVMVEPHLVGAIVSVVDSI